jgi:ATPase subunit of ABC transporter with duplicated ATPase domains
MYDKILQKLRKQRNQNSSVSDRSLEDMAKTLAGIITTDSLLEVADFSALMVSIEGNISHYTAEQVKKLKEAEEAAKKKEKDEAAKKTAEKAGDANSKNENEPPEWAKVLMERTKQSLDEIQALKKEKTINQREQILKKSLENTPEYFAKPILSSFSKLQFETDEDFTSYKTEVEKQRDDFAQALKEQGLNTFFPKKEVQVPEAPDKAMSPAFKKAFEEFDKSTKKDEK